MRRYGLLIVALLLALPATLWAQHGPEKCGKASFAQYNLKSFSQWLSKPLTVVRRNEPDTLHAIPDTATKIVMTDKRVCGHVLNAGLKELRAAGQMKGFKATGFVHRVFRLGPYYVIMFSEAPLDPSSPHPVGNLAPDFVLFFSASSVEYLGEVIIPG